MIKRRLQLKLEELRKKFPVIGILGPRQSGKTTLSRDLFSSHKYINLEELDTRRYAVEDPRGFIEGVLSEKGVIIDEIQYAPGLLSYIQVQVDKKKVPGFFVLTGSQNILISQHISQTLAGRIALVTLLPLSLQEVFQNSPSLDSEEIVFQGLYPSIYSEGQNPGDWYSNYIRTYIERDVRQIKNITDLSLFQKFLKLCAGRIGQLVNLTSLGNDCGINAHTVRSWLSVLEASYILFLVHPHHKNFTKRVTKMPKLYFYDTGIACQLLEIASIKDLSSHYLRGGLFESLVLSDLIKQRFNRGMSSNVYFWRDKIGNEIDCILEQGEKLVPVEIKAGKTISSDYFNGLSYWNRISGSDPKNGFVVYAGKEKQQRSLGNIMGWQDSASLNES